LRCNENVTGVTKVACVGLRGLGGQNTGILIIVCFLKVVWDVKLMHVNSGLRLERWAQVLRGNLRCEEGNEPV
jgi:hypothetical protein